MPDRPARLTDQEVARALASTALFAGLAPDSLERLAARAVQRSLARGELVFLRGEPGTAMYVVCSGLLKVYETAPDGTELVLTTVPPGATVGELALVDGGPRSASVAALHASRVLVVGRTDFQHALREDGALAEPLLAYLGAHLRRVTDFAADLVFLDLSGRVAKLLVRMADVTGRPVLPGLLLDSLTQSELAAMVGASRQSTNAVLRGFVQDGLLDLDGRQVRLLRPDLLRERARDPE